MQDHGLHLLVFWVHMKKDNDCNYLEGFCCDESGVAGFVIAAIFAIAALSIALMFAGSDSERGVTQSKKTAVNLNAINGALIVYATQDANQYIPCPADGSIVGAGRGIAPAPAGDVCALNAGIVPYRSLGMSESDVTDAQGTLVTLIVDDLSVNACNGVTGRAGNLVVTGGSQPNALFALVSHGLNRRGGYTEAATQIAVVGTAIEADNCADGVSCNDPDVTSVTVGPFADEGNGDLHFDDRVLLANSTDFDSLCLIANGP